MPAEGAGLPSENRVFFPNLDGLRFVAFLLVFLQHGFDVQGTGGFGVSFFFVLSGFLITYLILAEIDQRGRLDVRAFWVRRILRIWPLYYAVLAFCFVVYPALRRLVGLPPALLGGHPAWYVFFLSNFDVLRRAGVGAAQSVNVTWSVAIEEQFYLTWPLLLRWTPKRHHLLVFLAIISASLVFRLAHAGSSDVLYYHSASVVSDMAIGGLAAHLWRRSAVLRRAVSETPRALVAVFYGLAGLFLVGTWLGFGFFYNPFQRILVALVFALIVLEQNFTRASPFKMSQLKGATRLGRYTYGLYLLHTIVLTLLGRLVVVFRLNPVGRGAWLLNGPGGLGLSIAAAWCSYHLLEQPFLRLKGRFAHVRSGA